MSISNFPSNSNHIMWRSDVYPGAPNIELLSGKHWQRPGRKIRGILLYLHFWMSANQFCVVFCRMWKLSWLWNWNVYPKHLSNLMWFFQTSALISRWQEKCAMYAFGLVTFPAFTFSITNMLFRFFTGFSWKSCLFFTKL